MDADVTVVDIRRTQDTIMSFTMTILRTCAPRVFAHRSAPAYPRALAVGMLLLAGACSKPSTEGQPAADSVSTPSSAQVLDPAASASATPLDATPPGSDSDTPPADSAGEPADAAAPDGASADAGRKATGKVREVPHTGGVPPSSYDSVDMR